MSAYRNALTVNNKASEQQLALAANMLEHCEGIVELEGVAVLRPERDVIVCEVIDPNPDDHRCEEEFKVLVENASRALAKSKLAGRLPVRRLQWSVVSFKGEQVVEQWRST